MTSEYADDISHRLGERIEDTLPLRAASPNWRAAHAPAHLDVMR